MKIQKEEFYTAVIIILILAGVLACSFPYLTDKLIIPATAVVLECPVTPEFAEKFTPDVAFLAFYGLLAFLILRVMGKNSLGLIVIFSYASSMFFCFFYFFIAPVESLVMLAAFFVPVYIWHLKKISNIILGITGGILILFSWKLLGKPALFVLMMPMCHLFAIRAHNALQSRYSGSETRIFSKLSTTQQNKVNKSHSIFHYDLWEVIGPEIQALLESWTKVSDSIDAKNIEEYLSDFSSVKDETRKNFPVQSYGLFQKNRMLSIKTSLTDLNKRDTNFSSMLFIEKVKTAFNKIQQACCNQNIETIQCMVSDALFEQFSARIQEQKDAGIRFSISDITFYDTVISSVISDENYDQIQFFIRGEVTEIALDILTGEPLNADNQKIAIMEYWSFIRRPSAKTYKKPGLIEGSCPNCSAPIQIGQATVCPACSSYLRSGHYDWVLNKITHASEWGYSDPEQVLDWKTLKDNDKNISIHQIEDRSAVIFWMHRLVERKRTIEPLIRFATDDYITLFTPGIKISKFYSYMENVSFASATLKAVSITTETEKIYVLIVWSGIPVTITPQGRQPQIHRFCKPRRDVFVLTRKAGSKTNLNNTLSSAHCMNCGGQLISYYSVKCRYCNSILNDGDEWILDKVLNEQSSEYTTLMNKSIQIQMQNAAKMKQSEDSLVNIKSGRDIVTISAQMMLADGKMEEKEVGALKKLSQAYAMSDSALNGIIESVKNGELIIPKPVTPKEALKLLDSATAMAMADGKISEEEMHFLEKLAKDLGYYKPDIEMSISRINAIIRAEELARKKIAQRKSHISV
ncbi:MAG: TIM44-like domain-containing protein [Candidatus Riflebacteria bacterium]|nr:TIM44-like domain-containing protein [Candidatus Riflebacteria bacterium]